MDLYTDSATLTKKEEHLLCTFEKKVLRRIFGGINADGVWRRKYNNKLRTIQWDRYHDLHKNPNAVIKLVNHCKKEKLPLL